MADVISRSYNDPTFTNTNNTFLQTFNNKFPLQKHSWKEFNLPTKVKSKVISCLLGKPLKMELWTKITKTDKNIGTTGKTSPNSSDLTLSWKTAQAQKKSSLSQHLLQGSGQDAMAKEILSEFQLCQKHLLPSPQPLRWVDNPHQSTKQKKLQSPSGTAH